MDALDILIRKQWAINGGSPVNPERAIINLIAPGATLVDNPVTKQSDLTIGTASGWTSFVPTFTTTGTALSLGNGVTIGRYRTVGKDRQLDLVLRYGSTTSLGTGNIKLPIGPGATIDTSQMNTVDTLGAATLMVAVYYLGSTSAEITGGFNFFAAMSSGNLLGPAIADLATKFTPAAGEAYGFLFSVPVT